MKKSRLAFWSYMLPIIVITYMVVAISWWAVLIYREHRLLFDSYYAMHEAGIDYKDDQVNLAELSREELKSKEQRHRIMILSETIFIGLTIMIGLFLMQRVYRKLIQNQRMKQNFLLSVSHELKSPLASIKLSLQSLSKLFHKDPPIETLTMITEQGIHEVDRLHNLVNNILISTRIDSGYVSNVTSVPLQRTLARWIRTFHQLYPGSEIHLDINRLEDEVLIDIQALEVVACNLLDNGLKYGGQPPKVEINIGGDAEELYLSFADNGSGIPEEKRRQIFDRFYRMGDERIRKTKGTGIGLYLVKTLLHSNGADISVDNSAMGGALFEVSWPIGT